jgi:type II secretory ATPase GspE/PulE/Tfp pilus assembly ATPase PilB-like protein
MGVYEGILVTEEIDGALSETMSEKDIQQIADKQGILTMIQDGVLKTLQGITTLDELSRVIDLEE